MKKYSVIWVIGMLLTFTSNHIFAQQTIEINSIEPFDWRVSNSKTSNLVFPHAIVSVDLGSNDILVQQAKGVENILQIKAGKEHFEETNLTVITADGKLYSYILRFAKDPSRLNIRYNTLELPQPVAIFSAGATNVAQLKADAEWVMQTNEGRMGKRDQKHHIRLLVAGIFVDNMEMYYKIKLKNKSNIHYEFEKIHFFISDQINSKRTASQEVEIKPLYIHQNTEIVEGGTEHVFVFALPKFTIPEQKNLNIQVMEKNGGRHLALKVPNRKINQAKIIPDNR